MLQNIKFVLQIKNTAGVSATKINAYYTFLVTLYQKGTA